MWHTYSTLEVCEKLNTNSNSGLKEKEAQKRKKVYGDNVIKEKKKSNIFTKFLGQFKDFMIIILLIASLLSGIVEYMEHTYDYTDSIIIIAIVVFNAIIGVIQESKAEKSIEALKKLASPICKVKRDGKIFNIDTSNLVPGDLVLLENGNLVPADCRLTKVYNLKIDESALTGETEPVEKNTEVIRNKNIATADMHNMAFSSTIITSGHAEGIVTDIGMNTNVGKIAGLIISSEQKLTPLQERLSNVGKNLGTACIIICIIIFIIGTLKHIPITEMFMTAIGLAVAAIPEGLPAIVTIMLSIGVTKMAKKNAIIRKLPAVETLGCSSIICSDKTGTLTQNKMEVTAIYGPNGKLESGFNMDDLKYCLKLGAICNNSILEYSKKDVTVLGEPTELAITKAALKYGAFEEVERINEIPFDSKRKMMTTINKEKNKILVISKGAPDIVIKKCSNYYENTRIHQITSSKLKEILRYNEEMSSRALRVLAVAYKEISNIPQKINPQEIEDNLTFVGLIGMIDPPREGVNEAIKECKRAGIKTVMITGDHIITAKAIATKLGILSQGDLAITGKELDEITDRELEKNIMKYSVFARVSPEHKVRIVNAFKKNKKTVAMTGDGINDAPALKNADIGIAMGQNGTDVAKSAADMILTDDNFVTIVEAVKEGRHIYDNIKKAIHFLLATNVGEIFTIFFGLILGVKSPLLAIQLLWINLITDSLPAIALGLEPMEVDIMRRKPINSRKSIFSDGMIFKIITEGIMIGILTLFTFNFSESAYSTEVARTMTFIALSLLELFHSFNVRSESSIFEIGIFKNKYLMLAFISGTLLQVGVVTIPAIANLFEVVPLTPVQWIITIIISISPIFIFETKKKLMELIHGKVVYTECYK